MLRVFDAEERLAHRQCVEPGLDAPIRNGHFPPWQNCPNRLYACVPPRAEKLQFGRVEIGLPENLKQGERVALAYRLQPDRAATGSSQK